MAIKIKKHQLHDENSEYQNLNLLLLNTELLEEYHFAYWLNKTLELNFKQIPYHQIVVEGVLWEFPIFHTYSLEWKEHFYLIRNKSLQQHLPHGGLFESSPAQRWLIPEYSSYTFILASYALFPENFSLLLRQTWWIFAIKHLHASILKHPHHLIFEPINSFTNE